MIASKGIGIVAVAALSLVTQSTLQRPRLTSARDVAYTVMHEACGARGVLHSFLALDGRDNTDVSVIKCLPTGRDGQPLPVNEDQLVKIDPCDGSAEAARIRTVMAETPELPLTLQCADSTKSAPVFPSDLRAAFDGMAAACKQRGSAMDRVQWTRSGRWVQALTCKRSDESVWDLNICDDAKDVKELRTLLSKSPNFPVSCAHGIPTENAAFEGWGHCPASNELVKLCNSL